MSESAPNELSQPRRRSCAKPSCGEPAVASMSFDHANSTVYVGSLLSEREPSCYDLCRIHTDRLSAPKGWAMRREPMGLAGEHNLNWHESEIEDNKSPFAQALAQPMSSLG